MNYKLTITLAILIGLYGCQQDADQAAVTSQSDNNAATPAVEIATVDTELVSGIDQSGFNESIRPQDDFFDYVNGTWVDNTEIPGDKARWGTFDALAEQSQKDVRVLVDEVSAAQGVTTGSPKQKIRDFYNSYLDTESATEKGIEAIRDDLDAIAAIDSMDGVYRAFSSLSIYGVNSPIGIGIFSDMKNPDVNAIYVVQAGLTLPDRDYYLLDDEQFVTGRQLYLTYVTDVLNLAGFDDGAGRAERLLALETSLAKVMWTKEENRDWSKRYNPMNINELNELAPQINWTLTFESAQIPVDSQFLVSQPSYFESAGKILSDTPLDTWKDYLNLQTISNFALVLGDQYAQLSFDFFDKGLTGVDEQEPRWKQAIESVNDNMGELLGQLYVEKHFQIESKARMDIMIQNLIKAYEVSILELDWMSGDTKQQALESAEENASACGPGAAASLISAMKRIGKTEGKLLGHTHSCEVMQAKYHQTSEESVGYAAIIY